MGFEPARQRYIASQKPNALPTELSGRFWKFEIISTISVDFIEIFLNLLQLFYLWERGGLVVERRTPNREVLGSIPTRLTVLCP